MTSPSWRVATDRSAAAAEAHGRRPRRWFGENPEAWSFVLPAVVIILGLSIVPMVWSLILSMQSSD
ncbi:MAG TPA: hypothetical protein VFV66_27750, partial [Nonomuraea sp.]|nr:hypothetical protein [Nonomuraea sp.]